MGNPFKKLVVIDFDGTLVWSPSKATLVEGVPAIELYDRWAAAQGLPPRKWQGWWGRKETLMPPIFGSHQGGTLTCPPECLNHSLVAILEEYRQDPVTLSVLMTGRHAKMTYPDGIHVCRAILDSYKVTFDEYHYNTGGDTLQFKCKTIDDVLNRHPAIDDVTIYEDRADHVSAFFDWIKLRKREKHIRVGNVVQIYPPEASFGDAGGEE